MPQQPGAMPQQQPGGMPQQPGWGQQPAWAPPAPKSQSSSARPLLLIVLFILLIGLGFLTVKYTALDETLLGLFKGSTGGGTTTVVDTTKPVITDVRATDISTVRATIRWTTDDLSSSQVEYGTTDAYGSVMPAQPDTDPSTGSSLGAIEHIVNLTGLEPDTEYHYRVKSKNAGGLEAVSSDKTVTTTSAED